MIPLHAFLSFFLSLPLIFTADHTKIYHSGYQLAAFAALPATVGTVVIVIAKIFDHFFSITLKSLAWAYRNNHRTFFKIFAYKALYLDEPVTQLNTQFLLNACMWQALEKNNNKLLSFLLECGANPNIIYCEPVILNIYKLIGANTGSREKKSLLVAACHNNNTEQVRILLQHNAHPNANKIKLYYDDPAYGLMGSSGAYFAPKIENSHDPLRVACHNNNKDIVELLTRYGCNIHPFIGRSNFSRNNIKYDANMFMEQRPHNYEITVSAIDLAICHKNLEIINHLMLHTLQKNNFYKTSPHLMYFLLCLDTHTHSALNILPKDVKQIIFRHIYQNPINQQTIESCYVMKKNIWLEDQDFYDTRSQIDKEKNKRVKLLCDLYQTPYNINTKKIPQK